MAIPLPGETILIAAAAWAGTTHKLRIELVITAAAAGAIVTTVHLEAPRKNSRRRRDGFDKGAINIGA